MNAAASQILESLPRKNKPSGIPGRGEELRERAQFVIEFLISFTALFFILKNWLVCSDLEQFE